MQCMLRVVPASPCAAATPWAGLNHLAASNSSDASPPARVVGLGSNHEAAARHAVTLPGHVSVPAAAIDQLKHSATCGLAACGDLRQFAGTLEAIEQPYAHRQPCAFIMPQVSRQLSSVGTAAKATAPVCHVVASIASLLTGCVIAALAS